MSEKEEEPPPSAMQEPLANNGQTGSEASVPPRFHAVSWFAQFYWCLWKNYLLLSRRPIVLLLVLFSSVFAMLLSWGTRGRDPQDEDVLYPTADAFNDCGSLRPEYISSFSYEDQAKLRLTLNENWRDGGAVAFMGLGAMVHGLFAFSVINNEVSAQLLGVLRALGLRDSVYWLSWYTAFGSIALFNSLLGAITAMLVPGNVYENVFFAGIFASLFFLNLSVIAASFFGVAVCGTSRKLFSNFMLLAMIFLAFIPLFVGRGRSILPYASWYASFSDNPSGFFWEYKTTEIAVPNFESGPLDNQWQNNTDDEPFIEQMTMTFCHQPILNEFQGKWFKTEDERETMAAEEIFVGW